MRHVRTVARILIITLLPLMQLLVRDFFSQRTAVRADLLGYIGVTGGIALAAAGAALAVSWTIATAIKAAGQPEKPAVRFGVSFVEALLMLTLFWSAIGEAFRLVLFAIHLLTALCYAGTMALLRAEDRSPE